MFRVAQLYLNLLVKPRFFFRFSDKKDIIIKKISRNRQLKKICVPTLPKSFSLVTRNTLILLFGLKELFDDHKLTTSQLQLARYLFVCVDALHPSQQFFSYVGDNFLSYWVEPVQSSVLLKDTTQVTPVSLKLASLQPTV